MSNETLVNHVDAAIFEMKAVRLALIASELASGPKSTFTRAKALAIASTEAEKNAGWRVTGEAKKYTAKFEPALGKNRFPWCASFVTYCCEQAGLNIPMNCPTGYTFALCEAWQIWAQKNGFYIDNAEGVEAQPGDIVLFDWSQRSVNEGDTDWEDHIGFIVSKKSATEYVTAEGNVNDFTAKKIRFSVSMQGFIRIPDNYRF